jgi:hypothetical protein
MDAGLIGLMPDEDFLGALRSNPVMGGTRFQATFGPNGRVTRRTISPDNMAYLSNSKSPTEQKCQ